MKIDAYVFLSLSITFSVILSGQIYCSIKQRKGKRSPSIANHDLLAASFLHWKVVTDSPFAAGVVIWVLISGFFGVLLPLIFDKETYFMGTVGLATTLNYTILVPLLLGSYLSLLTSANQFFNVDFLKTLNISLKTRGFAKFVTNVSYGRIIWHFFFAAIVLLIQWSAINNEVRMGLDADAWIEVVPSRRLNVLGVLYYALRGINTYLAIGLLVAAFLIWKKMYFSLKYRAEDLQIYSFRVNRKMKNIGASLLYCSLFTSAVIGLAGVTLFLFVKQSALKIHADRFKVFLNSTWLGWLFFPL